VPVIPNSVTYTEGFGEQQTKTQSLGGGAVQTVWIDNAESKFSTLKFSIFPTVDNVALARSWKAGGNNNAASLSGQTDQSIYFTRSFNHLSINNNYEVTLGADGKIDCECASDAAV
jgi:hypothetical protein